MASPHAVPIIRELGIRESHASGTLAVFGTADHATPYPSCCAKAKHHQTNRLAYFSSHLFDAASIYWRGTEDHAGAAASLHDSRDARYVYASGHDRKAQGAGCRGRAFVPRKNARNVSSVKADSHRVYPFCTFLCPRGNGGILASH